MTLDKISVFGFDKNEWSEALLKEVDADQLPVHYGGTMIDADGDPKCPSKVRKYYLEIFLIPSHHIISIVLIILVQPRRRSATVLLSRSGEANP